MKQQKDSPIKNATTDPREPLELPKPTLRPGAEDFLKIPSLRGEKRVAHAPASGIGAERRDVERACGVAVAD